MEYVRKQLMHQPVTTQASLKRAVDMFGQQIEVGQVLAWPILQAKGAFIGLGEVVAIEPQPTTDKLRERGVKPLRVHVQQHNQRTWVTQADKPVVLKETPEEFWKRYTT